MLKDPTFWVAVAFIILIAAALKMGVAKLITGGLDERADKIKGELEEAQRLRDEAAKLLADYQRKAKEAEDEAQAIVASAKQEADRLAVEAKAKMDDFVARRTQMAETKIAQAEAQALADVRAAAADAAVAAAGRVLAAQASGKAGEALIASGIAELKAKLN